MDMLNERVTLNGFCNPKDIPGAMSNDPMRIGPDLEYQTERNIEAMRGNRRLREMAAGAARARGDMQAAADIMDNGSIVIPRFQPQILDMVRRRGALGQRTEKVPATGQPHRYIEQRAIVTGAFVDPRLLAPTPGSPLRAERSAVIKAISGQTNFGLLDVELARQQGGQFDLTAKDIEDMVTGVLRTSDDAIWQGTDTDLLLPTQLQYVGLFTQINRTAHVDSTASIIDAINDEVASIMENQYFTATPTAIYGQPTALAKISQEAGINLRQMAQVDVRNSRGEVIAGVTAVGVATPAGVLPLIADKSMGASVTSIYESGKTDYTIAILTENLVEQPYVTAPEPRLFVLGLQNNLATQYVCVLFDCVIAKGKAEVSDPESTPVSYAHSVMTFVR